MAFNLIARVGAGQRAAFTTLYQFPGGSGGGDPKGGLAIGSSGALYGTTSFGGSSSSVSNHLKT
jgi:hypothetical protein